MLGQIWKTGKNAPSVTGGQRAVTLCAGVSGMWNRSTIGTVTLVVGLFSGVHNCSSVRLGKNRHSFKLIEATWNQLDTGQLLQTQES